MPEAKGPTVIIAEPQVSEQRLVDLLLSPDQYAIEMFASGDEVAEYLRAHTPDLLILDALLPKLSGLEICGKIRRVGRLKHVPVVILIDPKRQQGEFTPTVLQEMAKLVKADAVLQKPLGDKNLRVRVRELLDAKAGRITTGRTLAAPSPYDTQIMVGANEARSPLPSTELAAIAQDLQRVQEQLKALAATQQTLRDELNSLGQQNEGHIGEVELTESELTRLYEALTGLITRHDHLQQKILAEVEDLKVHSYAVREGFRELTQRQADALAPLFENIRLVQAQKETELTRLEALRTAQLALARTLASKRLEGLKLEEVALRAQLASLDDSTPLESDPFPGRLNGPAQPSDVGLLPVPVELTELQKRLELEGQRVQELETRNRLLLEQLNEEPSRPKPRGFLARWRNGG